LSDWLRRIYKETAVKQVKIIVIQELTVPDDMNVTTHPTDFVECIEVRGKYYMPTIGWLEREEQARNAPKDEVPTWVPSEKADELFADLISEDGVVHELKGLPPEEEEDEE
jgi:hypothetical protein